jgi:hypothetical protein
MIRWAIASILIFLSLRAQALTAGDLLPDPDQPSVILVTIGPGDASYEKFGHNAIWIHDPSTQTTDVLYNYGVFDFADKNFVWNFIQGLMTYRIERVPDPDPTLPQIEVYDWLNFYASAQDRSLKLQQLNLTPEQQASLRKFLDWNTHPANQFYRYNYDTNNCSTKVRDAIDGVIDHQIQLQTSARETGTTFRWHTRRLTADDIPLYAALDYVMGHPIDRPISKWEEMFLPVKMSQTIRDVEVNGSPLVKWEKEIYTSKTHSEYDAPPSRFWVFIVVGLIIGGVLASSARLLTPSPWKGEGGGEGRAREKETPNSAKKRNRTATPDPHPNPNPLPSWERGWGVRVLRWIVCLVAFAWVTLAGLGGGISTWGWWFTDHFVAKYNENLLQLNPITLPLIVLVPIAIFSKRRGKTMGFYLSVIGLVLSILGFILQVLPKWNQPNADIIALALPAHAGLAWLLYRLYKLQPATSDKQLATNTTTK